MSDKEIEQLQQQLREKVINLVEIYGKLVGAGVMEMPDDLLDAVLMDEEDE